MVTSQEEAMAARARRFSTPRLPREALRDIQNFKPRAPSNSATPARSKSCKFFAMPSGCVRGDSCGFPHDPGDSRRQKRATLAKIKKILVSGLPPFVESEDLFNIFEHKFGSLVEAVAVPHSDEQTAGRFGVLTFKNEESLFAAIQANNVFIFGQKVTIEVVYGRASTDFIDGAQEIPCRKLFGSGEEEQAPRTPPPIKSLLSCPSLPPWAQKFRSWLPEFLVEVSKRIADGEAYPLCSLKGDFRATCGLEIDHTALGFEKLSDFIRAWPEICKPRVVPVGSGPATHLVLDPVPQQKRADKAVAAPGSSSDGRCNPGKGHWLFNHGFNLRRPEENPTPTSTSTSPPQAEQSSGSGRGSSAISSVCMSCLKDEALWVAFPCGHRALCTSCKDEVESDGFPCFFCQGCIEGWAALP